MDGDVLVLYTDRVRTGAENRQREFGMERLSAAVRSGSSSPPRTS